MILPAGEREKSLARAEELYGVLYDRGVRRSDTVVALGGGVIGDLGGFVAATFQRGVGFVQVPTTLLAQVDASVGGKVAVDFRAGKNYVGTFYQPSLVLADLRTLETLPERELRCGAAEVAKHGLLAGSAVLRRVRQLARSPLSAAAVTQELVASSIAYKAGVVERDEREAGLRAVLNFGHTIGHAIEAATGFRRFSHGEAVGLGLHAALRLSGELCRPPGGGRAGRSRAARRPRPAGAPHGRAGRGGVRARLAGQEGRKGRRGLRPAAPSRLPGARRARPAGARTGGRGVAAKALKTLWLLHGVNLDMLGRRDPAVYGSMTLTELEAYVARHGEHHGFTVRSFQTNHEGEFVEKLHQLVVDHADAAIINPGAWTHYSYALHDALELVTAPVAEVHLSDIENREEWRRVSVIADVVDVRVCGKGAAGYVDALGALAKLTAGRTKT